MRVSIERGYHAPIEKLMSQLQTDDPKLAVHHIIGCWLSSNGCPGQALSAMPTAVTPPALPVDDEFADIIEY